LSAGLFVISLLSWACAKSTAPAPIAAPTKHFTLGVESLPSTTPPGVSIYVAGNFNRWNPGDTTYRLRPDGKGNHLVALPDSIRGPIEFKFTLGSWDAVETDSAGADIQNRSVFVKPASRHRSSHRPKPTPGMVSGSARQRRSRRAKSDRGR